MNKDQFTAFFRTSINVLKLGDEDAARIFKVSKPTIKRWKNGDSAPHELGREPVAIKLLQLMAELDVSVRV